MDWVRAGSDIGHSGYPLAVAYYTVSTPYEEEAKLLRTSLEKLGIHYLICGVPNLGSWQKNTQYKPIFLRQMLHEYPNQPLLYLDVDALVLKPLDLLKDSEADLGAVYYIGRRGQRELLSGTLYLGGTVQCRRLVDKWIRMNRRYPETLPNGQKAWDQRTLAMTIERMPALRFVELPQEYAWIDQLTEKFSPGLDPVIRHTRGAKRLKKIIDGKKRR